MSNLYLFDKKSTAISIFVVQQRYKESDDGIRLLLSIISERLSILEKPYKYHNKWICESKFGFSGVKYYFKIKPKGLSVEAIEDLIDDFVVELIKVMSNIDEEENIDLKIVDKKNLGELLKDEKGPEILQ